MKGRVLPVLAVAALAAAAAAPAQAYDGPCKKQSELFEKYNIEFNMDAPLVAHAYNEACSRTG